MNVDITCVHGYFVGTDMTCENCKSMFGDDRRMVADSKAVRDKFPLRNSPDTKDTNPKDAIGSTKIDLGLVPDTLLVYAALGFTEGALKYGRYNWRIAGVRASIYRAALQRHLVKWWNGEEADPVTGVPHLASALCCIGILIDSSQVGNLNDDRPPSIAGIGQWVDEIEKDVAHLKQLHADKSPHQYTIADTKTEEL